MANEVAVFGGGCFWCLEAIYQNLKGIIKAEPGYAGGHKENPTYDEVSSGTTGHAEVIRLTFDDSIISYQDLLDVFFYTHDPTTLNRQGQDVGDQYRSLILYNNEEQKIAADNYIKQLEEDKIFSNPIVTKIEPLDKFYLAEDYHKNYYKNHKDAVYCQLVIKPKISKLRDKFTKLLAED